MLQARSLVAHCVQRMRFEREQAEGFLFLMSPPHFVFASTTSFRQVIDWSDALESVRGFSPAP